MSVTWHSVDLKSGRRGGRLITQSLGAVERIIGEPTELSGLRVLIEDDGAPVPGWDAATLPGRTMLVALDDDDEPLWGGMVVRRRASTDAWVNVDLVTLEAYWDRRFVKDHTYTQMAQGVILRDLITTDVIPNGISFAFDAFSSTLRDRAYVDDEDKTVLSVAQELMAVEGGPEFTIDLAWADEAHTVLSRIVRIRSRLGTGSANPVARFDFPGSASSVEFLEDFTSENGANDVMATSSGEGESRPESTHAVDTAAIANGWPRYEARFSPSTSIIDRTVLDAHARARLSEMRDGVVVLSVTARMDAAPMPGRDFYLGDDVAVVLTCPRFPERVNADGERVAGFTSVQRCVGYKLDFDAGTLEPRFMETV